MLPEKPTLESAVTDALSSLKVWHLGMHYQLDVSQIVKIVGEVLKVLGTLSEPECQDCIAKLIADFNGPSPGAAGESSVKPDER